ncbi:hypothetical protein FA13DRAFT_1651398 [Coprinellus micaceus]|uniref:Uncharacterized protein n=1 Tax=Coprinellus micaceus TaxID=71717 RepID=A0A4Y7S2D6_COPMI|nr:hypothetical protein FA13DRAFT_1651398 [Coprinellus micaceus]
MWDDRLPGWDGVSYLTIKSVSIALVYWREVYSGRYRGGGPNHWHTLKPRWSDWKKVALRWNQGSPQQFWSRFSDAEGNHMDYTTTLRAIQDDRRKDDEEQVKRAREEYGSRFDKVFTYRKGNTWHVLTKDVDIAKKYRSLKGGNTSDSD